jgi:hypothetical protein
MNTDEPVYPYWQREGPTSRFFVSPAVSVYQVEEVKLIGGSMFAASVLGRTDLLGQFESEKNAKDACLRDLAEAQRDPGEEKEGWGLNPRRTRP